MNLKGPFRLDFLSQLTAENQVMIREKQDYTMPRHTAPAFLWMIMRTSGEEYRQRSIATIIVGLQGAIFKMRGQALEYRDSKLGTVGTLVENNDSSRRLVPARNDALQPISFQFKVKGIARSLKWTAYVGL